MLGFLKQGTRSAPALDFISFFALSSFSLAFLAQKFLVGTHFCFTLSWMLKKNSLHHPQSPPPAAFTLV